MATGWRAARNYRATGAVADAANGSIDHFDPSGVRKTLEGRWQQPLERAMAQSWRLFSKVVAGPRNRCESLAWWVAA